MGFLDTLLGRTKPVQPKLDDLFALPSAAITLDAGAGFKPTGSGSVCFRPVEGRSFTDVRGPRVTRGMLHSPPSTRRAAKSSCRDALPVRAAAQALAAALALAAAMALLLPR